MTIGEALRASVEQLRQAGVDSPHLDAERVLAQVLGLTRVDLYAQGERRLSANEAASLDGLVRRRVAREPLAYVLGEWSFRRLTLRTDARALVPRPETEVLVERALALLDGLAAPRVLDVGVGTGAVALSLAYEHPRSRVTATDVSTDALALARENADTLGLDVELVETNLLEGLAGPFDLIVSNPPYVRPDELGELDPEVHDWEPRGALLDEGQTDSIARGARDVLAENGVLVLEVHSQFAGDVAASLVALGYHDVTITRDLAGRERVVDGRWTP